MVLRGIAWSSAIRIRFDRRRPFGTAAGLGRSGPLVPTAPAAPAPSPAPPAWRVARRFRGIGGRRRPLTGSGAGLARGRIKISGARLVPPRRRLLRSRRLGRRPAAAGRLFSAPAARSAPGPSLVGVVPRRRRRLRLQDRPSQSNVRSGFDFSMPRIASSSREPAVRPRCRGACGTSTRPASVRCRPAETYGKGRCGRSRACRGKTEGKASDPPAGTARNGIPGGLRRCGGYNSTNTERNPGRIDARAPCAPRTSRGIPR